jgi:Tol biopolymer transport system component
MKKRPVAYMLAIVGCLALIICTLKTSQAQNDAAQRLFQEGIFQMEAMGDFATAIEIFEKLVSEHPGNKPLASRALLMKGRCHEILGRGEAEKAYNRILEEYGDQREVVNEARARLMALTERTRLTGHTGMLMRKVWEGCGTCELISISADERHVAYSECESGDLFTSNLGTGQTRQLTSKGPRTESTSYALYPVFSPDGSSIAYTWQDDNNVCSIHVYDLENDEDDVILDGKDFTFAQALAWSPDGKSIILMQYSNEKTHLGLFSLEEKVLTSLKSFDARFSPANIAFSPDGKFFAYDHYEGDGQGYLHIYCAELENNVHHELVIHPSENIACGWTPDGSQLVFISDRTGISALWTIAVTEGKAAGMPEMLKTDISQAITPFLMTESGSFIYGLESGGLDVYKATFNPEETEAFGPPVKISHRYQGYNRIATWSNDGNQIAYTAARKKRQVHFNNAVVIQEVKTGIERELILEGNSLFDFPRWSYNDSSIAVTAIYLRDRPTYHALLILNAATGKITDTIRGNDSELVVNPNWSWDGKHMYFNRRDLLTIRTVLMARNLETGEEKVLYDPTASYGLNSTDSFTRPAYSPDHEILVFAFISYINQRSDLYMIDLKADDPQPSILLSAQSPEVVGRVILFDEEQVYFLKSWLDDEGFRRDYEIWTINIFSKETRKIAKIPAEFQNISLHPDGKTALFNMGIRNNPCEIWAIDNLLP